MGSASAIHMTPVCVAREGGDVVDVAAGESARRWMIAAAGPTDIKNNATEK